MRSNRGFLTILCLVNLDVSNSRTWMDCVDSSTLANDGMPRVSSPSAGDNVDSPIMMAEDYDITMHGSTTSLFEEVDPFRVTESPSSVPSFSPSVVPSATPSTVPSHNPSISPTISIEPTSSPTKKPTRSPTSSPTFSAAAEPRNPNDGYFNYDNDSDYGPDKWKRVEIENDFWHTFELKDSKGENECGSGKDQSPIDVCTNPRGSCTETHEMRPKVSICCNEFNEMLFCTMNSLFLTQN